ncbi:MAG: hypothetical protein IKT68_08175 [Clostridia bacterium]|nr:hypothetical protein [Clostridia bacterium]
MNPMVREYLEKHAAKKQEAYRQEKDEFLLSQGLCQKIWATEHYYSEEFPQSEWDVQTQSYKFFKTIPIEVTDSEYEQMLAVYRSANSEKKETSNGIATALTVIAVFIFIVGFIVGLVLGNEGGRHSDFAFDVAFLYWLLSFIGGVFVLGFAEIIKLLHKISNK